jgi:hypothetical protein
MEQVDQVTWNFMADRSQLPHIQAVVVLHDLRFVDPIPGNTEGRLLVRIGSHRARPEAWRKAQNAIAAILHPPVETPPTRWQRFRSWLRGLGPRRG